MSRFAFILRRLAQTVPLLALMLFVVYVLVRLVPGNPARAQLGLHATPARVSALDRELGLDQPLLHGYLNYLWHALHGDLGTSVRVQVPVAKIIAQRVGVTLWLLIGALFASFMVSVPLATLSALRRDRAVDHTIRTGSVLGLSIPTFWLALVFVSFIALPSGLFPVSGFGHGFSGHLHSIVLPALVLAIGIAPIQIRALRVSLIGVLECDYIAAARALGLSGRRVLIRHVMPNALSSSLTLLAAQLGLILFGEVIVENAFALPGVGQAMLQGVVERDYPVVQGLTLLAAVLVIATNLLVDVAHVALDPRVELR
jgi:peptide/nickel transport system permease protein